MSMKLSSCAWSDEAARTLESSTKWFPLATVEDYRLLLERDPDAQLYRCDDETGLIGFAILKIERFTQGAEGVILAASAYKEGVHLVELLLPAIEGLFAGVTSYRVTTAREGLVWKLEQAGWLRTHVVMRKVAV